MMRWTGHKVEPFCTSCRDSVFLRAKLNWSVKLEHDVTVQVQPTTGFGVFKPLKIEDVGMQGMYIFSSVSVSPSNQWEFASWACLLTNEYKSA